jgi:hypothetical protein
MISISRSLFVITAFITVLTISCSPKNGENGSPITVDRPAERHNYAVDFPEIINVEPVLQRFSLPEYKEWLSLMDSLFRKYDSVNDVNLMGITDSVILNDLLKYDPVDMGWSDSHYIDSVFASSVLAPQGKTTYSPANCADFQTTAWVEGSPSSGEHESISFIFDKFDADEPMTTITLYNGFQRSESLFKNNARIKTLRVSINGTLAYDLHLKDTMKGQMFPIEVKPMDDYPITLTLEILAVYPGDKYTDAAITEIIFDGTWLGI